MKWIKKINEDYWVSDIGTFDTAHLNINTYKEHYALCRESCGFDRTKERGPKNRKYDSVYELATDNSFLGELDKNLISEIHQKICYKIDNKIGCFDDVCGSDRPTATRIIEWHDIEEIKTLADSFMPIVEEQIFGCHAAIEFVLPYRNIPNETLMKNEWDTKNHISSWKWHYDDTPREYLKFFVYLNEVTENSGCLKYLTDENGTVPEIESFKTAPGYYLRPPIYAGSRIPPDIVKNNIEKKGWKVNNVVGPSGTYLIHTPNIYHRATCPVPGSNPRDVLFFMIRPKLSKEKAYISKETKSLSKIQPGPFGKRCHPIEPYDTKKYKLD